MRTNLIVPYEEKDDAKKRGARWDSARKIWYVEDVENIAQFMRWMPAHLKSSPAVNSVVAATGAAKKRGRADRIVDAGIMAAGKSYFRTGCNCVPWEPCSLCVAKVETAGWWLPA